MGKPRSSLVSLTDTPWYHVMSRCVRRAYLCGADAYSGRSYEHRRGWVADRIRQLAGVFAVDVAAYAVMSNHYHVVVRLDAERVRGWSREEVLRRWTTLFDGPIVVRRVLEAGNEPLDEATELACDRWAEIYRSRLCDLSWFMRVLNETIARRANREDSVTGRFWEGRFKSQALLDERAVLTAMAYVDLNPIRAQMARTLESSDYTSVAERLTGVSPKPPDQALSSIAMPPVAVTPCSSMMALKAEMNLAKLPLQPLMPFDPTGQLSTAIPFGFHDYVELVERAGRNVRKDKHGAIDAHIPPLLKRLGVTPDVFLEGATKLLKKFGSAVGAPARLLELCSTKKLKYLRGMRTN